MATASVKRSIEPARSGATAGRIHRLGAVDDPLDLYPDADVFVLASEGESFGMVAAEAAASGTPVVVTDRCGVAEVLGPDGALVVANDRGSLLDGGPERPGGPGPRDGLGARGREIAAANAWPVIVERQDHLSRGAGRAWLRSTWRCSDRNPATAEAPRRCWSAS